MGINILLDISDVAAHVDRFLKPDVYDLAPDQEHEELLEKRMGHHLVLGLAALHLAEDPLDHAKDSLSVHTKLEDWIIVFLRRSERHIRDAKAVVLKRLL